MRVARALRNLVGDPGKRGHEFLNNNAGRLQSVTDNHVTLQENFAQLLILEATGNRDLVTIEEHPRTWNFFVGKPLLTTEAFPYDLDTTSLGLMATKREQAVIQSVMDEMLEYVNADGIIQTYFDHTRPRFDPVVCTNVLSLFYSCGRGHQLNRTLQWVHEVLLHRAYLDGTRYYATPECFLYFLSRLLQRSDNPELHQLLKPLLKERVQERIGAEGDALALAMRILVCDCVGIRDDVDLRALLPLQSEDGGWENGWMYKYGASGIRICNRGLTTALAINAIKAMEQSLPTLRPATTLTTSKAKPFAHRRTKSDILSIPRSNNSTTRGTTLGSSSHSIIRWPFRWLWPGTKIGTSVEAGF